MGALAFLANPAFWQGVGYAGMAAGAAGTVYSSNQQTKATERAAAAELDASRNAANKQVEAQKEAQQTARDQLRAAQAKKTSTVLTKDDEDKKNVTKKTLLG
jgi:hypothetical protein